MLAEVRNEQSALLCDAGQTYVPAPAAVRACTCADVVGLGVTKLQ